jgi:hypothetical protein
VKGSAALAVLAVVAAWPQAAAAAPWCGTVATEDRPAVVGGNHVRVLYAIPSDGADRSSERAPQISSDLDEIDAWWRINDSSRTLRFDLASFPCGLQADLMLVRLGRTASELASNETRFDLIVRDPQVDRLLDAFSSLLVYYDGPVSSAELCGEGGTADGRGAAVVYLAACSGISTAAVATHELLHAFGAVAPSGPPNACPGDVGHVCDSTGDILYPRAQFAPLSSFVLDVNRDDYYGHGRPWLDVRASAWLRHLDAQAPLDVLLRGEGSVSSDVPGIACTSSCRVEFNRGTPLTLVAEPEDGQRFVRWEGACSSVFDDCPVTLDGPQSVTALFAPARFRLSVSVRGRGRVTSPVGIACLPRCVRDVVSFERIVLRAVPARGWKLKAWSGACRGPRPTCALPMSQASSARATFVRLRSR